MSRSLRKGLITITNNIKIKTITMEQILKQKDLTAIEKLILIDMQLFPQILIYNKMSAEIASSIGVKQKDVKVALNTLEEKGIIKTNVGYRTRSTQLTKEFKNILK